MFRERTLSANINNRRRAYLDTELNYCISSSTLYHLLIGKMNVRPQVEGLGLSKWGLLTMIDRCVRPYSRI